MRFSESETLELKRSTSELKDFEGDLFYLIERTEEYILKNIHIGMKLDGLRRIDVPEIDKEAFREAIINAFCHRDYYEYDSVNIAVFKDRVEIRSPGGLYGGLTIGQIMRENVSKRRNEQIADIFHRVHFVEKWGRGIELILTREPTTTFKVVADIFITTFKRKDDLGEKLGERWSERWSELNKNQRMILSLMVENPRVSRKELSIKLNINQSAIQKHIEKLKEKGLLRHIGPAKGGYWEIIK